MGGAVDAADLWPDAPYVASSGSTVREQERSTPATFDREAQRAQMQVYTAWCFAGVFALIAGAQCVAWVVRLFS